jgi:DNA-nicking Smr family endonuclease
VGKRRKLKEKLAKSFVSSMPYEDMFVEQACLDIHEFGPMLHADIHKMIEEFIEDQYNAGLSRIRIVTGKGLVVRPMTLRILKKSQYVKEFRFAGYFTGQNGALEILLKQNL